MVIKDFFTQSCRVDMRINLGGSDALMAQHGLNGSQISTTLEQRSGETMAQGVGRNGLLYTRFFCLSLDHDENHGASEVMTTTVQEHKILFTGFDIEVNTVGKPQLKFLNGTWRNGHKPLFRTLAEHANEAVIKVELREFQVDKL